MSILSNSITLYAIMNKEGKYFKNKCFTGNNSWVDSLAKARIYTRIGPAKAQITYWGKNYPEFSVPMLVVISGFVSDVLDYSDYVTSAIDKNKTREDMHELRNAKQFLDDAQQKYNSLISKHRPLKQK